MRKLLTALTTTTVVLVFAAPAAAVEPDNRCLRWADRYQVEEQTRFGVLFSKPAGSSAPAERLWYGCIFSVERAERLPWQDPVGPPVSSVRVADLQGRYVMYGLSREEAPGRVIVYDVKTGGPGQSLNTEAASDPNSEAEAVSIVGNRRGSTAWIAEVPGTPPTREVRVWSAFEEVEVRTADRGPGIAPESLALSEDHKTVYWLHDGQPRTTPID